MSRRLISFEISDTTITFKCSMQQVLRLVEQLSCNDCNRLLFERSNVHIQQCSVFCSFDCSTVQVLLSAVCCKDHSNTPTVQWAVAQQAIRFLAHLLFYTETELHCTWVCIVFLALDGSHSIRSSTRSRKLAWHCSATNISPWYTEHTELNSSVHYVLQEHASVNLHIYNNNYILYVQLELFTVTLVCTIFCE